MAVILHTGQMQDHPEPSNIHEKNAAYWTYNGLDCCVTNEVCEVLDSKLDPGQRATYNFTLQMRAPAFYMNARGIKIDQVKRDEVRIYLSEQQAKLERVWSKLTYEITGRHVNHRSVDQLKHLFYKVMCIPPVMVFDYKTKTKKESVNREALEKLSAYFYAKPLVTILLSIRDIEKKLQVVKTGISSDGRMRASYNVVGTETGRWSSSKNGYGGGTNNQNITDEMREMFIPDKGRKFGYVDLEQAESRGVAYISGDSAYIAACNSGDLHTFVCRLIWPELPWTGDLSKDKKIAERPYYRHFSYRDMSKRGGHASNYYAKPPTISKHLKIQLALAEEFQYKYFGAFPGIRNWQLSVGRRIASTRTITTLLGRKRLFFGRPFDDATLREAIAFEPQSIIGDLLNVGLFRVFKKYGLDQDWRVEPVAQVHDAVLWQYWEEEEATILPLIMQEMIVPIDTPHGKLIIPTEATCGWNWRKAKKNEDGSVINPWGLSKFNGNSDTRTRPETLENRSVLDRLVCAVN